MTRRGACLTDLIHVGEEWKHLLILACLIDQRFAATERSTGSAEEIENEGCGLGGMNLPVGLFFGPAGAGDEKELGIGANGLTALHGAANAGDRGAWCGQVYGDRFSSDRSRRASNAGCVPGSSSRNHRRVSRLMTASSRWR